MKSFEQFLALLQCPACSGDFAYAAVATKPGQGRYGVLTCRCSKYPVLDDVPVLMKGEIGITIQGLGTLTHGIARTWDEA